ncbi:MAG: hypothetical protein ACRDNG_11510 [Gaiellaceae bacterium]
MARYLAELYLSKTGSDGLRETAGRARSAAEELTREGIHVRYVRALFLGEDETCFHLYEAATADAVLEATRRAEIPIERLVEAVEISPAQTTPPARQPPGAPGGGS